MGGDGDGGDGGLRHGLGGGDGDGGGLRGGGGKDRGGDGDDLVGGSGRGRDGRDGSGSHGRGLRVVLSGRDDGLGDLVLGRGRYEARGGQGEDGCSLHCEGDLEGRSCKEWGKAPKRNDRLDC